jgi:hypothetical protein
VPSFVSGCSKKNTNKSSFAIAVCCEVCRELKDFGAFLEKNLRKHIVRLEVLTERERERVEGFWNKFLLGSFAEIGTDCFSFFELWLERRLWH